MAEQRDLFGDWFERQDLLLDRFLSALVVVELQCTATLAGPRGCRGRLALLAARLLLFAALLTLLGIVVVVLLRLALLLVRALLRLLFAVAVFLIRALFLVRALLLLLFAVALFFSCRCGLVCLFNCRLLLSTF